MIYHRSVITENNHRMNYYINKGRWQWRPNHPKISNTKNVYRNVNTYAE